MKPAYLLAALLSLAIAACSGDGASNGAAPPMEVDVITVASGNPTLTQELPGRLLAWRTAEVRARVEGILEKRLFKEGSDVRAGVSLFRIDPRQYKAAVDSANADVDLAKLTLDRYKQLLEIKAVSKQDVDQAEAKLKQAEATLAKARIDYENTAAPAPISGRIGRALVTEGALVGKGEATQLATIEQIDPLYANFTQTTTELMRLQQQIQKGRLKKTESIAVEVVREDGSVYAKKGKLLFSDLAVDPNTGAVLLRAEIPNPQRELLPGMFVRIRFPEALAVNAITIPQRAVQATAEGHYVLLVGEDGKVAQRAVKLAGMSGQDWIVAEGLKPGEKVIVNGLQKTRPGATVKPVEWNPNQTATPAAEAAKSAEKPTASEAKPAEKGAEAPAAKSAENSTEKPSGK